MTVLRAPLRTILAAVLLAAGIGKRLLDRASLSLDDVAELPTGHHVHERFYAISMTIAAGTTQVNKNIVGERVLGLPKDR